MSIESIIDNLNKDYIYEEGIFDCRKLYQNKKKVLFLCLDRYLKQNPNIDYKKVLQLFYNKIGFGEAIEYNSNIFASTNIFDEQFINNLIFLMINNKSLKSYNNIKNYFEIKSELCNNLYKNMDDSMLYSFEYDGEWLTFNDKEKYLKCLIFIKKYNVSINFVEDFLYAFNNDIENIEVPKRISDLFKEISYIYNTNNINELKQIFENSSTKEVIDFYGLYNNLADVFSSIYLENCYKPQKEDLLKEVDGIQIYEAPEECFMFVHVLGGFFFDRININSGYKNDWNSRKENFISMSAIGPEFSETCDIKDVCYGFYSFNASDILGSSTKNLGMHQHTDSYDYFYPYPSVSLFGDNRGYDKFCLPHNLLIESKKIHNPNSHIHENEVAYKRYDKNGKIIQPDYIIYFSDDNNEELFQKSMIAAKEFNVPIVMVSKKKWLKYENNFNEINNKMR